MKFKQIRIIDITLKYFTIFHIGTIKQSRNSNLPEYSVQNDKKQATFEMNNKYHNDWLVYRKMANSISFLFEDFMIDR